MLLKNSIWMYFFQGTNFISPLVIYPLLLAITNPRDFGVVAVILSFSQFYAVIVDFGANTIGVERFIGAPSKSHKRIVSEIQSVKFLIVLISFAPIILVETFVNLSRTTFFFAVLGCICQSLFPLWLFHSKRNLSYIAKVNAIMKLLLLLTTYIFVDNIYEFITSWAIFNMASLIAYTVIIKNKWKYNILVFDKKSAKNGFLLSWKFATAKIATSIYTTLGAALVGLYDLVGAGSFMMAEQIYRAGQSTYNPFFQAAYPVYIKSRNLLGYLEKVKTFGFILLCLCVALFIFSHNLIGFLYGQNELASKLLKVFSLVLLFNFMGVSFGYNVFVIFGKLNLVNRTVTWGGLIFSVSVLFLTYLGKIDALNVVCSILLTEFFVANYRIKLFRGVLKSISKY